MSQENMELVRRAIAAAFAQPPEVERVREFAEADIVLKTHWGADEAQHHGVEGVVDAIAEMVAAWDPWSQDLERLVDAGPDTVVALLRLTARGRGSGVPVEFAWAMVFTVRNGRIAAARAFIDQDEALKAVAVEE
jgi:ketosteroid isomerase-like protein